MDFAQIFERSPLRKRILFLSAFGVVAILAIIGISDFLSLQKSVDLTLSERLVLARTMAANLEYVLRENLQHLQEVGYSNGVDLQDQDLGPERAALHQAALQSICVSVFLLDRTGHLLLTEPQRPFAPDSGFESLPPVKEAVSLGKPLVSNVFEIEPQKKEAIFLLVPLTQGGAIVGFVGGEIDPTGDALSRIIRPLAVGKTTAVDIVDGNGIVLASTQGEGILTGTDHRGFLSGLIRTGQSRVSRCHSCHQSTPVPEIMAFVPLTEAPWGVSIRQSEEEALGPVESMKLRFFVFGFILLLVTVVLTLGIAQSVIAPVKLLTSSAIRIAGGNLEDPVPISGEDEIGQLGKTLDEMRLKLKDSMEQIEGSKRDLEKRVEERTQEVRRLFEELKRKEEMRGELLRKTITAQEDERKRIARELHDELSQTLTALLYSLDSARTADPEKAGAAHNLVVRAIDNTHRLIYDLRPSVLDDLGLAAAIQWYAEARLKPLGISAHFEWDMGEERLPPELETALFRIAQESMTNVARHSGAENVIISLEHADGTIVLEVEDDGKGFDLQSIDQVKESGRGLGVLGMKERASLLDGAVEIESNPGSGTRIAVRIPYSGGRS